MNKVPFFRRIQWKLTAAFLVPVVFIIILGYASFERASAGIVTSYETSVNQTVQMMNQYLSLVFDTVQSNYKGYINEDVLIQYYKGLYDTDSTKIYSVPKQYTTQLHESVTTDSMISNIYVISDKEPSIGTGSVGAEQPYAAFLETQAGAMVQTDKYSFFFLGKQSTVDDAIGVDGGSYGVRMARYLNGVGAILLVDINKSCVEDTLSSLDGGENSYTALVTCDGSEYIKSADGGDAPSMFAATDFYQNALAGEEQSGSSYVTYEGRQYLFLYSKIEGKAATICSLIPQENIVAQVEDIKQITVLLVLIASAVAIGLGTVIAGKFGKTINGIVKQVAKVGEGDLTVEIKTHRKDEFKLLAVGIAEMVANMKGLISNVTEASGELTQMAEWVSDSANTFVETSEGIKEAISDIETGTSRLDEDSAGCLGEMDTLSDKMELLSENAGDINEMAEDAKTAISAGIDSMGGLSESATATTAATAQVIRAIGLLEEKSKSIGQIIKTINEIAEQTNLLSLNASIEAARAGEAGKGFAVVAEEIKKLADESLSSSAQIEQIVDEIVKETGQVVTVAKHAEDIIKTQGNAVQSTGESFGKIDTKVASLMQSLLHITEHVSDMEEARERTLNAITGISAVSTETASGAASVNAATEKQADAVKELDEAAGKLTARAEELLEMLQRFTVEK